MGSIWCDCRKERRKMLIITMKTLQMMLLMQKIRTMNQLSGHGKHQSTWQSTSGQEFWARVHCRLGIFHFTRFSFGIYLFSLFTPWFCSMNAPVMVELEGETDPLEVRAAQFTDYHEIFWKKDIYNLTSHVQEQVHLLFLIIIFDQLSLRQVFQNAYGVFNNSYSYWDSV